MTMHLKEDKYFFKDNILLRIVSVKLISFKTLVNDFKIPEKYCTIGRIAETWELHRFSDRDSNDTKLLI